MRDNKAKEYSRQRHKLALTGILFPLAILSLFIITGLPPYIRQISSLASPNDYINLIAFSVIMSAIYYLSMSGLSYYSGFALEHRFSLSNQTLGEWIKKEAKTAAISVIIGTPLIILLYTFIRYSPVEWWLLTAISWFLASVLLAKFAPIVIVPLFYKYSPIKNKALKDKLLNLVSRAGFKADDVYEINISKDTKKANAALMGLGRQKRIVLCDTLLENFSEDEIESVMGHELGHHKLDHVPKLILFEGLSTLLIFYLANIIFLHLHNALGYARLADFESLVLIYAVICALGIFILPLRNAFSRILEKEADAFALNITGNKAAFISTMKKLAAQNLADPDPGKFYEITLYSHPPISRRVSFAESFKNIS
ncbi:MAG: M48 family metallopeptidase [Candidatus Omnitrophica bacterium]|nr:M48 family metallopeptidase [Candidatus Omnitrophota bacterium]